MKKLLIAGLLLATTAHAASIDRPAGAYTPSTFSNNATKYQDDANAVPRRAISSAKVDGDLNKAYDGINGLDTRLTTLESSGGVSPGNKGAVTVSGSSWTLNSGVVSRTTLASDVSTSLVPVGTVMSYAGPSSTLPLGWALGFGQSVSRTGTYGSLFGIIGTTYGSADGNSFNLPDCRGRVIAYVDNLGGTTASRLTSASIASPTTLGGTGGDQMMQSHAHGITDPGHAHVVPGSNGSGFSAGGGANQFVNTTVNSAAATTGITVNTSGTGVSQNVQPTILMNCIVKY